MSKREPEEDKSSGLSCSTLSRLVGVTRRLPPLNKPCKPCTYRWDNSEPGDSTAPACSSSIAPSARLSAGSRAAACLLQPLAPARAFRKDPCPLGNLEQTRQPKNDALARRNQLNLNLPDPSLQGCFHSTFDPSPIALALPAPFHRLGAVDFRIPQGAGSLASSASTHPTQ